MQSWAERIQIHAGGLVLLAALLLLLPLQWVMALVLAAAVHECFHALAVWLLGGRILHLTIGPGGAVMETLPMEGLKAFVCSLAGPAGSLSLLLVSPYLPRTAICGLVQGCYNLLPLLPLDGGKALSHILLLIFPEKGAHIIVTLQRTFRLLFLFLALWASIKTGFWTLSAMAMLLFLRTGEIKLAKKPIWRYNRCNINKGV